MPKFLVSLAVEVTVKADNADHAVEIAHAVVTRARRGPSTTAIEVMAAFPETIRDKRRKARR